MGRTGGEGETKNGVEGADVEERERERERERDNYDGRI